MRSQRRLVRPEAIDNTPNFFIGGLGTQYPAAEDIITRLAGVQIQNVTEYSNDGKNIKFKLTNNPYSLTAYAFKDHLNLTYFIDYSKQCGLISVEAFKNTTGLKETIIECNGAAEMLNSSFQGSAVRKVKITRLDQWYPFWSFKDCPNIRILNFPDLVSNSRTNSSRPFGSAKNIYIPKLTIIGHTNTDDGQFLDSPTGVNIWGNPILQTSNAGAEEGDLAYARANKAANIFYSLKTDFEVSPIAITNLSYDISGADVNLSFTAPVGSYHPIVDYEVYVNENLNSRITGTTKTLTGIVNGDKVKVVATDIYYNYIDSNILTISGL